MFEERMFIDLMYRCDYKGSLSFESLALVYAVTDAINQPGASSLSVRTTSTLFGHDALILKY